MIFRIFWVVACRHPIELKSLRSIVLSNAQQSCEPATALDGMKIIDVGELALKFDYKIDVDERVY